MNTNEFRKRVSPIFDDVKETPDACVMFFQSATNSEEPNGHLQATIDVDGALALIFLLIRQFKMTEIPLTELFKKAKEIKQSMDMKSRDDTWADIIEAFENGGKND